MEDPQRQIDLDFGEKQRGDVYSIAIGFHYLLPNIYQTSCFGMS